MPIKSFALELKTLTPEGTFSGIASTYGGEPDQTGDIIERGAFAKTLAQGGPSRPLLADHRDVIGVVELKDSPQGLLAKGRLTLQVQRAVEVHALMLDGAIKGLSIGYQTVDSEQRKDGVRVLKEVKLYEISTTAFPANELAMVTSVKDRQEHFRIATALDEFRRAIKSEGW